MIYVGIDVASKKHDYYITSDKDLSSGKFITVKNDLNGFTLLKNTINQTLKNLMILK